MAEQNSTEMAVEVREELVQTAVKFLQNPNVVGTPLEQKQKFLQRKGLTDREVQIACERSGAYDAKPLPPPIPLQPASLQYPNQQIAPLSTMDRIRDILQNAVLFSAVAYAIYKFYERFIKPWLFGDKKKKSVEDQVDELSQSVNTCVVELKESMASVKTELDKINSLSESNTQRQLQHLQSDISTVKGLLLSRKQFPSVVSNSPVVPPSIPAWQLGSVNPEEQSEQDQDPKSEDLMEIGSGSTPSEPEQETKNSDSSLEIM